MIDLNTLKRLRNLASHPSGNNTYLHFSSNFITDMRSNLIVPIANIAGKKVYSFIEDQTSPTLDAFELDLDSGNLTMTFSETVDSLTFISSEMTLQSSFERSNFSSLQYHTILNGTLLTGDGTVLVMNIGFDDFNRIEESLYNHRQQTRHRIF